MSTTSARPSALRLPHVAVPARREVRARAVKAAPLGLLLAVTAALYLWGLSRNGSANEYYTAAVQAGTHSWKAFLFGSLDAANYITVDKPPASLWLMELSSRVFGFSSFSMLLPQVLEGVAAVALLYATVRRWFGSAAAILSGVALAITPVAALMFRFNNPDALLVLLLVAGAYCVTRAIERGQTKWVALAGAALGFAFLTKMMQAFVVLPAFGLAYLVAAPVPLRRRAWQLVLGGGVVVAAAGWWVALVELWPVSARPYIGGSTNNSVLELVFGYNGLGRLSGGTGAGGGGANFSGASGVLRLLNAELGGQIGWLLPAALIALLAGAIYTIRDRRGTRDRIRPALILWGGWLLVTAVVYSAMSGTIHPYYTNTLAPPIAVVAGVGAAHLWQRRDRLAARLTLAAMLAATGAVAYLLLDRTPSWHPWLRYTVLAVALAATAMILVRGASLRSRAAAALATTALVAALASPLAFTLNAVASVETGSNPIAGPATVSRGGFGGSQMTPPSGQQSTARSGAGSVNSALVTRLEHNASRYRWVAATASAQTAASLELSTGTSVMAIGGFTGSDNAITLAQFKQLVAEGKIHYYIAGGGFGAGMAAGEAPPGVERSGSSTATAAGSIPAGGAPSTGGATQRVTSEIESWVSKTFTSVTVGGTTVYDLTHQA